MSIVEVPNRVDIPTYDEKGIDEMDMGKRLVKVRRNVSKY